MTGYGASGDGGGVLVLVVGASGAGKDSLIAAARHGLRGDRRIVFPRRLITRADKTGEDHIMVDANEFVRLEADGAFFLSWQAHGERYAIPLHVRERLAGGQTVVVNVSRGAIAEALGIWPHVRIVHVTVAPEFSRRRLLGRRREPPADVERRLARADAVRIPEGAPLECIDNSGELATAVGRFIDLLGAWTSLASRDRRPAILDLDAGD